MFKALRDKKSEFLYNASNGEEVFFLAWTTTPWTLPSNLGLSVGGKIDYVLIRTFNPYTNLGIYVILAKALVNKYFKEEAEVKEDWADEVNTGKILPWKVIRNFKGPIWKNCDMNSFCLLKQTIMKRSWNLILQQIHLGLFWVIS
jgi:isoleucyl-tRNA synthetase